MGSAVMSSVKCEINSKQVSDKLRSIFMINFGWFDVLIHSIQIGIGYLKMIEYKLQLFTGLGYYKPWQKQWFRLWTYSDYEPIHGIPVAFIQQTITINNTLYGKYGKFYEVNLNLYKINDLQSDLRFWTYSHNSRT